MTKSPDKKEWIEKATDVLKHRLSALIEEARDDGVTLDYSDLLMIPSKLILWMQTYKEE